MFDSLWVEKYRPKTLDDIVLSDKNRKSFSALAKTGEIPNLLFIGNAGIGKTSLAKIITNDILNCQYIYINASDENGIDTIRNKVTSFAQTKSLDGKLKVIILDEVDGLTIDAQRALRNTMEEYSVNTRFILTANYKHRVIPPLQSRAQSYDLTPPIDGCVQRVCYILKTENIQVDKEQKNNIINAVKCYYPDVRKTVNELQKNCIDGKLTIDTVDKYDDFVKQIFKLIYTNNTGLRRYVIENESTFNNDYNTLLSSMFNYIIDMEKNDPIIKKSLIIISEHIYRAAFVLDPEINFYSCCLNMQELKN